MPSGKPLPRVLVLLAAYNGVAWIAEQIDSILSQQFVEVVLRVSDDCSKDGTYDIVHGFAERHTNVFVSSREVPSGGAGAHFRSMFQALDLAGCDYVALSDQDDVWEPDHLAEACAALRAKPGAGGYSCPVLTFGDADSHLLTQARTPTRLDHLFEGAGQGCTFVLTANLAARVHEVCERHSASAAALHYHDWLVYLVCRQNALGWFFDERPFVRYRQHGGNEIGARSSRGAVQRRLSKIRDGWYAQQVRSALALALALDRDDKTLRSFETTFHKPNSLRRRIELGRWVLKDGRRKRADRVALFGFVIAGWI